MPADDIRPRILELLQDPTLEHIKDLFWTELHYDRVNQPLARTGWTDTAAGALTEDPILFASGGSDDAFHILYARLNSDKLALGAERPVIARLLREHPFALFVFSNKSRERWHFVNVKDAERVAEDERQGRKPRLLFRRFTVGREERLRTAAQQVAKIDLRTLTPQLLGIPPLEIQRAHDDAFDVEALTDTFFKEYVQVFGDLQKRLGKQVKDKTWAHDYSLQLLNRLMFLYFIQRKRWLGDDPDFVRNFWDSYKHSGRARDTFFSEWLSLLFFEAFNNEFQAGRRDLQYLPEQWRKALQLAPYLNGGLFRRNRLDEREFNVPDAFFETVFDRFDGRTPGLLERYNFTIAEDTPFDQEVAVDPEMIGKVYESLVNVTTEGVAEDEDLRGNAGIFYTPRVEIDLMCRLTLLDYLTNHLGQPQRALLRDLVFAYDPDEKASADEAIVRAKLWTPLDEALRSVTALDITCGSGSFIVGMLAVLDDLQLRANAWLQRQESAYERRKRIIGSSLYGVDVKTWAVQIAELRLWLQLVVDAELDLGERRSAPLLPNLSFKIRAGDSLVQEIGGVNFSHRTYQNIPATLKGRLTTLKTEKIKFYNNDTDRKFRTQEQLHLEELNLFKSILIERSDTLTKQIQQYKKDIDTAPSQLGLAGMAQSPQPEQLKMTQLWRDQRDAAVAQRDEIQLALGALRTEKQPPFVWDIAFVEIFEGEREGFDILVGNPPYVRSERIAPPEKQQDNYRPDTWGILKKAYKNSLQVSVANSYPKFFRMTNRGTPSRMLDGKSDLYVYFYFYGLRLLNHKGSLCFITSNSWLDVGYGAELQEFLLKYSHVKLVLDNQARRSFKQADVNTVIALLSSADDRRADGLDNIARFVMFKVRFENILSSIVFGEIEESNTKLIRPEFRVIAKRQSELLEEGLFSEKDDDTYDSATNTRKYSTNKWGGKYLRAPDIYWTVLEKGHKKLRQLGQICRVETYLNTGGADGFFIVRGRATAKRVEITTSDGNIFELPDVAVKPFFKSPQEIAYLDTRLCEPQWFLVIPSLDPKNPNLKDYIRWGEKSGFHEKSGTSKRKPWFSLPPQAINPATLIWPRLHNERLLFALNEARTPYTNFYGVWYPSPQMLAAVLSSTLSALSREIVGKANFGQGVLKTDGNDLTQMMVLDPNLIDLLPIFESMRVRPILTLREEIKQQDRKDLDGAIFDELGLTVSERDDLYESTLTLIESRLKKAKSA